MRIAILSTDGGGGGAPRAMRRLADGLISRGHVVEILQISDRHVAGNATVVQADPASRDAAATAAADFIDHDYVGTRHTGRSNTFFSLQSRGLDIATLPGIERFDVFNLHWTNFMLNPETIAPLVDLGRPVVFTLHDMGHFTGGCHYSAGCNGFEQDCSPCLQIGDDALGMTQALLAAKRKAYRRANVAAVAPSHWLAERAARSGVFEPGSVTRISNGIETDVFRPMDKVAARQALGLSPHRRYILFGAHFNDEKRKGFTVLVEALRKLCGSDADAAGDIGLLIFGEATPEISALGLPVSSFGFIGDDERLATIYNATDLLVLPSLEDNQPNVMLEAMASGVPVVASAVGGMKDVIVDGINGRLVPPNDAAALAAAIHDLVGDAAASARLGEAARQLMLDVASIDDQARRYEALFATMLEGTGAPAALATAGADAPRILLPERVAPRIASAAVLAERERLLAERSRLAAERSAAAARAAEAEAIQARRRGRLSPIGKLKRRIRRILGNRIGAA